MTDKYFSLLMISRTLSASQRASNLSSAVLRSFAIKTIESKGLNVYRIEAVCDTNLEIELFKIIKPYNDEMILLLKKDKKRYNYSTL